MPIVATRLFQDSSKVGISGPSQERFPPTHVSFNTIPIEKAKPVKTGSVEVSAERRNNPRNGISLCRGKLYVKPQFCGDASWHSEALDSTSLDKSLSNQVVSLTHNPGAKYF